MMEQLRTPRRPRHAAMRDDGGRNDHRERARTGRGVKPSQRPGSPPREPRLAADDRARDRPSTRPEPSAHRRRQSRDRGRDRDRPPTFEHPRRPSEADDLIPRYRASRDRRPESEDKSRRQSGSRGRGGPDSSPPAKRHRSRSQSLSSTHRKRSRKDRSPQPRRRDYSPAPSSRKRGRHSPGGRRKPSPRRHARSPRSPKRHEDTKQRPGFRAGSRSPVRSEAGSRRAERESQYHHHRSDKTRPRSRSRSPQSEGRAPVSRPPDVSSRVDDPGAGLGVSRDREDQDVDPRFSHRQPPRSPKAHRDRRSREDSIDRRFTSKSDIEDDMASRGSYRGGYNSMHSHKSQYGGDPGGYSQSPQHPGSYHNSSPSHSPYGASRSGWSNNQQYSPPQQYPPQYHQSGGYGPPTGPAGHYHSNPSHSPPYSAPTGPMQQYPQGNYRGNYRGNNFRGSFPNRGGHRGSGFKNSQWNSSQGPGSRGYADDVNGSRFNASNAPSESGDIDPDSLDPEGRPFRPSQDQQDDHRAEDENEDLNMAPPSRPPPSGPGSQASSSGKFSFAFKPSSKPAPTAPKPEISQKFNAAPPRRELPPKDARDREPPKSAPTEPASARSRHDARNPLDGPRQKVRTRKVKKILTRPKARPTLPEDLVSSESVFYRKPGDESVVGSGTYGKVFKGLNVYTKGLVALKRIRMEGERDGFPVTAVREIKLLQSLRHPNIVKLQEVMVEKNDCFMVFEYLSHDLTGLLNHPSFKLDSAQKKHLAMQLFEGLDYLHTRGVLHRDIKAANILVSNNGILKLADFGLARFYAKRHQLDYTNRVITIWYRSPELLLGETQYTAAVDVWSAACVMIEIFTRHAIFPGDGTELSQLEKIYNLLGTPNLQDWPGLVDMAWFELLRPTVKRRSIFGEKYKDKVTADAFDLLSAMFQYDPAKRPNAAEVLKHRYFVSEEPLPRQAVELANIEGEWHEFESKALRKENERRDREARRAAKESSREKDKKRLTDTHESQRESKRVQVDQAAVTSTKA